MLLHVALVAGLALAAAGAPVEKSVLYDQRQEGEWNVHASLDNFVLLVIPTQGSSSTPNLFDLLLKSIPKAIQAKRVPKPDSEEENVNFLESKTAPYHVDISQSKKDLAKLHPIINAEEIVIAQSPTIALVKEEANARVARAFVVAAGSKDAYGKKPDYKKKQALLKLLGAENEQCGPGLERDEKGVCRLVQNV